jgi:transposase
MGVLVRFTWDIEFHDQIDVSNLVIMVMLVQNLTKKCNQPISYVLWLLNNIEQNYTTIERDAFTMVYALHKFHHYLLGNTFIFYVDHMALLYLV